MTQRCSLISMAICASLALLPGCSEKTPPPPSAPGGEATTADTTPHGEKGAAVPVIGHGERVKLEDYIVKGKTTIFDFYSEYCPPCRKISPALDALHRQRDDLAVVKVDINRPDVQGIDWASPVVSQYGLSSVPAFRIYAPSGELQYEGEEAYKKVLEWTGS